MSASLILDCRGTRNIIFNANFRFKGEQNLNNLTTITSSPGNIWTRQVLDLIPPGEGMELRLVFEAKILDPSIPSHVAVDDISFKKSCLYDARIYYLAYIKR